MFVKSTLAAVAVLASLAGPAVAPAQATATKPAPVVVGQPLAQAHAHNDYEHDRPLFDALEHGFTSVEADVWLVDGELLVAHDLEDVKAGVTLETSTSTRWRTWCGSRATACTRTGTAACS